VKQPYQTWTMLTDGELIHGAVTHQSVAAFAHAKAVTMLNRGYPDHAAEWQKVQARNYRATAELMGFLLRRPS
jgi:hypothetical protein